MPFFGTLILQCIQSAGDTGVIDQNVNVREFFQTEIDQGFDFVFGRNIRFTNDGRLVSFTSARIRFAPSRAKSRADARPMPLPAPVIIAFLPFNRPDIFFSFLLLKNSF
jgi:hypothetical protein